MDKKCNNSPQEEGNDMPPLAPIKKTGLTAKKKAGLKQIMGNYSGKASLNTIRDLRKNGDN